MKIYYYLNLNTQEAQKDLVATLYRNNLLTYNVLTEIMEFLMADIDHYLRADVYMDCYAVIKII